MIILGNFNGYSQLWDPLQSPGSHGDKILDCILDNDFQILNDGSATRTSRITATISVLISLSVAAISQQRHLKTSRAYW